MANVTDDADDLVGRTADGRYQSFAKWFFIRKNCVDELLADNNDFIALSYFLIRKISSAQERNTQRAEVVLIDATEVCAERLVNRNGWTSFYREWQVIELATQW